MTARPRSFIAPFAALLLALSALPAWAQTTPAPAATPTPAATDTTGATDASTPAATDQPALSPAATDTTTPAPADASQATPTPTPDITNLMPLIELLEHSGNEGGNVVQVVNRVDGSFRMRGKVDLDHIHSGDKQPVNEAIAVGQTCTGCETFAVALQIALVPSDATDQQPQNLALGVNYQCDGCFTSARALQYVIPEDDPDQVPPRVHQLVAAMNQQLNRIAHTKGLSTDDINSQIDDVVGEFQDLAANLSDVRQDATPDTDNSSPAPSPAS